MKKFMGGIVLMCTLTALSYAETIVHNGVTYGTITSPVTGKVWLDRNLGAGRVCQSIDDEQCYGDYYQWGRNADGHEKQNSPTTTEQATDVVNVGHGSFILSGSNNNWDWATEADYDGSIRSTNWNICPTGYKVPNITELRAENIRDLYGAYNNLKLPGAGFRHYSDGIPSNGSGFSGYLWSSSTSENFSMYFYFNKSDVYDSRNNRANGYSVRCIKDTSYVPPQNQPPTANPGQNQTVYEGNPVTLSAINSTDSDGEIVSYEWSENGTVLSNDMNFTKDDFDIGVHTITLKVTDDDNASSEATVTVTVNEFPQEELTSNGEYTNTIDNIFTKRVYTFTLTEKSLVSIYSSSEAMKVAGWLLDENGTKISSLEDWQAGAKSQFGYNGFLNKGIYTIEFFPQNEGENGDFSFAFETTSYSDVIQEPWFIDIPKHKIVAHGEMINMCLSVKVNSDVNLNTDDLNISSDNLPNGLSIAKSYLVDCDFNLEGKIESDDFSINLNISDGNITKEHKIDFSVEDLIVDGIIGDGPSGEMVIRRGDLNEYIPFKVAFNLKGDLAGIESVSCLFGDKIDFGIDNVTYIYYTLQGAIETHAKYICDAESTKYEDFISVSSAQQLMNRLVSLDENERYMTVVVRLKDGRVLKKKILKKISIIDIEKPIQLWYEKMDYSDVYFSGLRIWRKGGSLYESYNNQENYVKTTKFNLNYGDEVTLYGGRWILRIGNHQMFMNLDEYKGEPYSFVVDENTEKDKTILKLDYIKVGEKLDLYFQKTGHNKLAEWIRALYIQPCVYTERLSPDNGGFQVTDQDYSTAVRGTTFKISLTNHGADFDLYEGELDINKSGKTTNLKTMQSYQGDTGKVREITNVSVPSMVKKYFDKTSLAVADINSTVSDMEVSTNSDKASFLLIGDHVRFGGGKVDLIKNISEGNYTLRFLSLLWHKKPEDRNITFDKDNLKEKITGEYQKIADVFVDGVAQDKKVDINVSSTNIRVDQLEDESLYLVTKVNDKNSSLNFSTMNSTVNVEKNGTVSTNIPLANDVRITIDKSGKVKPHIDDALLPKEDLPLGTQIEVIGDKVRFIVPVDTTLNF